MENKYFTPDIEDFCIGYEYEQLINQVWTKETFAKGSYLPENTDLLNWAHACILSEKIRVPYLTKEQIEAEGWKHDDRYNDVKHFYRNELHLIIYIAYHKEEIIYHHISIFHGGGTMFKGECKDINTFRKICKLLGI